MQQSPGLHSSRLSTPYEKYLTNVNVQGSFAFVDFENDGDAEKAKEKLLNKDMGGLKINIGKSL